MRRVRQLAPILLAAIFWIAQVQGTVHAVSHLGGAGGVSDRATVPHSVLCLECAAVSQAGAAPILSLPAISATSPTDGVVDATVEGTVAAAPSAAYRSRAPPLSPI